MNSSVTNDNENSNNIIVNESLLLLLIVIQSDPSLCKAIDSSLWETQMLLNHYHPDVARLPKVLETPALRKNEMNMRRSVSIWLSDVVE